MNKATQIPFGASRLLRPVQTDAQLSHPLETCTSCGWQFHDYPYRTCRVCRSAPVMISQADVQRDYDDYREEHRLTPLDAQWENT